MSLTDEQLMTAVGKGDMAAFEGIKEGIRAN
jgi:hypothetical protein